MSIFLDDALLDTAGVDLTVHTVSPGPGGTWTQTIFAAPFISDGTAVGFYTGSGASGGVFNTATPSGNDYAVMATVKFVTLNAGSGIGPVVRWGSGASGYWGYYDVTATKWTLFPFGGFAVTSGIDTTPQAGDSWDIEIKAVGTGIVLSACLHGGTLVPKVSISDSTSPGPGNAGVFSTGAVDSISTGSHISNVVAQPAVNTATGYTFTGPAIVTPAIATVVDNVSRGIIGGPVTVALNPTNSILSSDFTCTVSDGAGGTFTPSTVTITAGNTLAYTVYQPTTTGALTLTSTETSGHGFGSNTIPVVSTANVCVVCGDSHSDWFGTPTFENSWPAQISTWLAGEAITYVCFYDIAVSGAASPQDPDFILSALQAMPNHKIVLVGMGTIGNNISDNGPSVPSAFATFQTWYQDRVAAGWPVVIVTTDTNRGGYTHGSAADLFAVDALVRADALASKVWLVDHVALDVLDPDMAASTGNFTGDQLHLTPAGAAIEGHMLTTDILMAVAGLTPSSGGSSSGGGAYS